MKVLFNLNRVDDVILRIQFIILRVMLESNREEYTGVVEIVENEYAGAAYINLHSVYGSEFGLRFSTHTRYDRRPRFMMEEDEELDVSMVPYSYETFDEPPEDEEPEYEDDEAYEPEDDREEDR